MRVLQAGPRAVLIEVDSTADALSLAAHLRAARAADEIVPGAASVLCDGLDGPPDLSGWRPGAEPTRGATVDLDVRWDGADLDWLAGRWGLDVDAAVARIEAVRFTSAFCGFAPGFAYLSGLPAALAVPRLDTPRTRVPAGAVGLAGAWCGVYPSASPGGWRLLGTTTAILWDASRDDPALLSPGTRVRLRGVG